jgi:hypothetical protein
MKIGIGQDTRNGFPRPNVRVMRSAQWTTATRAIYMNKESMDQPAAFERFFLA